MDIKTPVLDKRTSEDIYEQALRLAAYYCPEWARDWEPHHFNSDDPGLVILKIFSNMAGHLITQFNKIPEKHYLAFLDFVGADLRPARQSIVPLTFYLADGASKAEILSGTLIASSKDADVVFETMQHLTAVAIKIYAFSINPMEDSYTNHSDMISGGRIFSIFGKDREEKPIEHTLHLGDDIFCGKTVFENLKIKLEGSGLSAEFFKHWRNVNGVPLDVNVKSSGGNKKFLEFEIMNIPESNRSLLNGIMSFWIKIIPDVKKKILHGSALPSISSITVDMISGCLLPDSIFYNDVPLDMKKGFYPFGESPKEGDFFYISSNEVLSKENSKVSLNMEFEKDLENEDAKLLWEFWDGASWKTLPIAKDIAGNFTKSGLKMIEFICPAIPQIDINGQSGRWIRVKIKSGGYGSPGKYEPNPLDEVINQLPGYLDRKAIKNELEKKGIAFGFQYTQPSHNPPFIKSINFVYSYMDRKIQHILAYNNFSYKQLDNVDNKTPFIPFHNKLPAFYLGFKEIPANTMISLYFSIKERLYGEKTTFKWRYYDGSDWNELILEKDETDSMIKKGIVRFLFPPGIKKFSEFEMELFWIKLEPESEKKLSYPELEGIFPNTVWASNYITVNDEILGSGNGMPGQFFSFARKPVLPGQIIEVRERDIWIKWTETSSFALSGKLSRDYTIDRTGGRILFGDGMNGMVPPKGKNNIRATFYRSGGGKEGNQGIGIIDTLRKANPNIERVTNHFPSSGGEDGEDNEDAVLRGPYIMKNRGAVTAEDFEWLAREASPDVKKARCIMDEKRDINVIILTDNKERIHMPDSSLRASIERYLKERALFTIREKIRISGPDLVRIDPEVTVKPILLSESSIISDKIKTRLEIFFDPVKGGQYGNGYDFGQEIYLSEVASVIESIEGVDYVEELILKKVIEDKVVTEVSGSGWISIEKNSVPYAGNIEIKITD